MYYYTLLAFFHDAYMRWFSRNSASRKRVWMMVSAPNPEDVHPVDSRLVYEDRRSSNYLFPLQPLALNVDKGDFATLMHGNL